MKNKHLRHLIIFGALVLSGLFVVQWYWFRKAFDVADKQFDHTVQMALLRVADSVTRNAEVKKLSSNFYLVKSESNFNSHTVDSLVQTEFLKRNLLLDYELGVYNAEDDTLVYGQYVEATKKHLLEQKPMDADNSGKNFMVYFPRKQTYVVAQLDIWIFSTLALLLMVCFFAWSIASLLRERRFAELKNDFINNMTHEFKTPVTNIGLAAEILRKKVPNDASLNVYLDILSRENEKLRTKIEQVLLGSSQGQQGRPALERIDIHQLILECADAFQLKVRQRGGTLQLQLDAKSSFILGDRDLLCHAINNVIDNAEKYSPGRPQILVSTGDQKNAIEIEITDKGIGIPEKLQKKVFEKFFRVRQGDIHNVKGFGLGLNFVKDVIRSHRGQLRLFSGLNQGTEIKIILPRE